MRWIVAERNEAWRRNVPGKNGLRVEACRTRAPQRCASSEWSLRRARWGIAGCGRTANFLEHQSAQSPSFDRVDLRSLQMILQFFSVVAGLAVPILSIQAGRTFRAGSNAEVVQWRRNACMASIMTVFLGWLALVLLAVAGLLGTNLSFFSADWAIPVVAIEVIATCLAFLARGATRILTLAAGILVTALWLTSIAV